MFVYIHFIAGFAVQFLKKSENFKSNFEIELKLKVFPFQTPMSSVLFPDARMCVSSTSSLGSVSTEVLE